MLTLLQQNLGQNSIPASTVLQELLPIEEELVLTDTITLTSTARPYVWAPATTASQSAEGGGAFGSFGYGSSAFGGGLPYADDAPTTEAVAPEHVRRRSRERDRE